MKLIPLEEAVKILSQNKFTEHRIPFLYFDDVSNKINSLPTIDPIATIDAEIAEWNEKWDGEENYSPIYVLEELKSRLSPKL